MWDNATKSWTTKDVKMLSYEEYNDRVVCGTKKFGYFAVKEVFITNAFLVSFFIYFSIFA